MPPNVQEIKPPEGWGEDAARWLEAHGMVAEVPTIRSSDYESCLANPFGYYLTRRLGLSDALRWSEALSRGSWFHKRFEYWDIPDEQAKPILDSAISSRQEELSGMCGELGIQSDERKNILDREEQDFRVTEAWFEAIKGEPLKWMSQPHFRCLGQEITGIYKHDRFKGTPLVAQFDSLLYHREQNTLWVVDLKTCAESPTDRLQTVGIEFQTQHYMHVAHYLLQEGVIQKQYDLPEDCTLGGMSHIAVQKPTINFGMNDRDFLEEEHTLKSGPRKGQIEIRRKYLGEPRFENYVARCKRWYAGEGEYENKKVDREENPPVNISYTYGKNLLDLHFETEYLERVALIHSLATRRAWPDQFLKSAGAIRSHGKISRFAPLYLCHPKDWPNIVQELKLITLRRDEHTPLDNTGLHT